MPWKGATGEGESGVPEEVPSQAPSQACPITDEYGPSSLTSEIFTVPEGRSMKRTPPRDRRRVPRSAKEDARFGLASRADPAPERS